MANYNDQARAIWEALDSMVAQDPEAYKKFITEQLQEGRKMVQHQKENVEGNVTESGSFEKAFDKMSLGRGKTISKGSLVGSAEYAGCGQGDGDKKLSKEAGAGDATTNFTATSCNLLDDEIGKKSILAQIVKPGDRTDAADGDDQDIDGNSKIKLVAKASEGKKKLLIEEI